MTRQGPQGPCTPIALRGTRSGSKGLWPLVEVQEAKPRRAQARIRTTQGPGQRPGQRCAERIACYVNHRGYERDGAGAWSDAAWL
ncbi:protein of unknown function [Rhodovastum atsumiense]|nr:protein of unknown function [Rhodovastum atsumiense]